VSILMTMSAGDGLSAPDSGICNMDWMQVALVATGLFVAGLVKGATGLGYSACALPFLVAAVGLKTAIVIVPIPAMAANIGLLFGAGYIRETLKRFWVFYAATFPGLFYGTTLLSWVDQRSAARVLGIITVIYAIYAFFRPNLHLPSSWEMKLQLPAGILHGFLTGLTGSQIIPMLPYMLSLKLDANQLVQAINIAVVTTSMILILALIYSGLMIWPLATASAIGILPASLGVFLGNYLRSRMPSTAFRAVVLFTLLGMGLSFMLDINTFISRMAG
jgi:uncharacterized membrane protein YfcA